MAKDCRLLCGMKQQNQESPTSLPLHGVIVTGDTSHHLAVTCKVPLQSCAQDCTRPHQWPWTQSQTKCSLKFHCHRLPTCAATTALISTTGCTRMILMLKRSLAHMIGPSNSICPSFPYLSLTVSWHTKAALVLKNALMNYPTSWLTK